MRGALTVAVLAALSVTPVRAADLVPSQDWTLCQSDSDCVVVGSICPNFYWAVHRDYVFANAARNAELRGGADCAPSFQPRPNAASCQNNHCQIPLNQVLSGQSAPQ